MGATVNKISTMRDPIYGEAVDASDWIDFQAELAADAATYPQEWREMFHGAGNYGIAHADEVGGEGGRVHRTHQE